MVTLDHLIAKLNNWFDNSSAFNNWINKVATLRYHTKSLLEKCFLIILRLQKDDLPSCKGLGAKLDLWVNQWVFNSIFAATLKTPEKVLGHVVKTISFNIMATRPVTRTVQLWTQHWLYKEGGSNSQFVKISIRIWILFNWLVVIKKLNNNCSLSLICPWLHLLM